MSTREVHTIIGLTTDQHTAIVRLWQHQFNGGTPHQRKSLGAVLDSAEPIICGGGAVAIPANGMWICVETDGYAHS